MNENKVSLQEKEIAAFACQSGSGAEKAFGKISDILGRDKPTATMILIDPKDKPSVENERKIKVFVGEITGISAVDR